MAPRPAYGSFIRQNEKPRLETRRRNHVRGHHADRPAHARDQALSARHAEGHRDTQRDARRFRPTRSPGRPDTSVPAVGRRTARAATGAGSPPRPSGSPWRWRGGGSGGRQVPARGVDEARPTSCPSSPPSTAGGSARTT